MAADFLNAWGKAPELGAGQLHLWHCNVDALRDPALLDACRDCLDEGELRRLHRFRFDRDRHRFLVSHAFLRHVLSLYAPLSPREWRYVTGEHGKPALDAAQAGDAPRFNLSHSDSAALIGVARGTALLGVDIERAQDGRRIDALAERKFAASECRLMASLPGPARSRRFHALWSLKESFIKARGEGLALPLEKFAFLHDEGGETFRFESDAELQENPQDWYFWSYQDDVGFSAAVAWRMGSHAVADPLCIEAAPLLGWSAGTLGLLRRSVRNTVI